MAWVAIRRALISVSDKTGVVELAKGLAKHKVEILSTGGTYKTLKEAGVAVVEVGAYTGFPEMMDGRVKTLHPKIHGGLLYRRDVPQHVAAATAHEIPPIDLVVVNLYPFEATVAKPDVRFEEAIENIDIGGPSMIRSAAKNHASVGVLTDPNQYADFMSELNDNDGKVSQDRLRKLALAAFTRTARYDRAIEQYLTRALADDEGKTATANAAFPEKLSANYQLKTTLRYGENPHQKAAFYIDADYPAATVASAEILHGKELSYNNILDLDSALAMSRDFDRPSAIIIKHNNPCGAAIADSLADAFQKAYDGDPLSAFGSVIGLNRPVDEETATRLTEPNRFVEAIIAPDFSPKALEILKTRPTWKNSVRLLRTGDLTANAKVREAIPLLRPIEGGMLRQTADLGDDGFSGAKVVTQREPTPTQICDLAFGWRMVKHVRSNAIVLVQNEALAGVGAGQMSRVDSVEISIRKAGDRASGAVLASDAFFPFRDNVDLAAKAGIAAIIQPGGSKRDQDSIDACNEHGIAMLFTGQRHFKH